MGMVAARTVRLMALATALATLLAGAATAQAQPRAEPITGPGVTTIGNIPPDGRVTLHVGPGQLFSAVAQLGYGTRVRRGFCAGGGSAQWCQVETVQGGLSGFVRGRFLVEGAAPAPPPGSGAAGPDFWAVHGLPPGDRLNVRRDPAAGAPALATLSEGEVVQNLGCQTSGQSGGQTRWCRIRSTTGMDVTGWVAGRYLREHLGRPPPPSGGGGAATGPDTWIVAGLAPGDLLNLRAEPSTRAPVLARLVAGDRVQNLGCRMEGQTRWCRVRTLVGADLTGWVSGRYLREG